jgi:RNA polymerase sigma-70 factor (ECF subfamily)
MEPDNVLLHKIAAGDDKAFRVLYDRYFSYAYRRVWQYLTDVEQVNDLLQDLFTKLWVERATLTKIECFEAWLTTVSKNMGLLYAKRRKPQIGLAEDLCTENTIEADIIHAEEMRVVHRAIQSLPPKEREIFELVAIEEIPSEFVAGAIGVRMSRVYNSVSTTWKKMEKYLTSTKRSWVWTGQPVAAPENTGFAIADPGQIFTSKKSKKLFTLVWSKTKTGSETNCFRLVSRRPELTSRYIEFVRGNRISERSAIKTAVKHIKNKLYGKR